MLTWVHDALALSQADPKLAPMLVYRAQFVGWHLLWPSSDWALAQCYSMTKPEFNSNWFDLVLIGLAWVELA